MELLYSANSTLASKSKLAFAASSLRAFCRPTVSQKKRPIIKLRLSTSFPCPCPVLLLLRTWVLCADSFLSPPECCDNLFFWGRSSLNSLKHWVEITFWGRILTITGKSRSEALIIASTMYVNQNMTIDCSSNYKFSTKNYLQAQYMLCASNLFLVLALVFRTICVQNMYFTCN